MRPKSEWDGCRWVAVTTETDAERAVDRAAKRGTRLSDPRLAALAAERGWELLRCL
jgi:hypothetical protein